MIELQGVSILSSPFAADGSAIAAVESAAGDAAFRGQNPVTGEWLEPAYRTASSEQIEHAVGLARGAAPVLGGMPGRHRGQFLRAIAERLEGLVEPLVERVGQEAGLTEIRVRSELGRTVMQLRMFADVIEEGSWVDARIDTAQPDRQPLPRPDLRSMLRPLGPVAVFGASNFPLAYSVAGTDTASALAAGCPVVVKAHPAHPGASELVGRAVLAAQEATGMPAGTFAVLFDSGIAVGEALVRHPSIQAVGFTGSLQGGRHVFDLAAAREQPIPVYAEMGSLNPVFLLPGALAARGAALADELHQSFTRVSGQFCTKPGLVFFDGNEAFRERLCALTRQTAAGCMLHAGIARSFAAGIESLRTASGVEALVVPAATPTAAAAGACLFQTTVGQLLENRHLAAEVFGPTTLLVRYERLEELIAVARSLGGQLTGSVHAETTELAEAQPLIAIVAERAGRVVFNQFPTGVEVNNAMVHGGPYPATTDSRGTSVGPAAIRRFVRPVCYQNFPDAALPEELRAANPRNIRRLVDGQFTS
ncbi:MAG: aldehyde dehydrogenase (NADP(+)) [Pirellulales bacterium]|nr:aldehyde dehydrogenase (NADP(+)) [Pirellulales bacterium]